jgi:shikimate dehydrogenase
MDTTALTKDTQLCMSLSGRPSNLGTRFHNFLYRELGLDYVYKAFTTSDLAAAIAGVRALGIRGCAISMPFKQDVIPLVDALADSAAAIDAVNTIVNTGGALRAYNTDYTAVRALLDRQSLDPRATTVAVLGSGGMAKAVVAALRDAGFRDGTVVARNATAGRVLADRYGFGWRPDAASLTADLIVNATPIGMAGGPSAHLLPVPQDTVAAAQCVLEVVAVPAQTPLVALARSLGIPVVVGAEVWALQAAEQFALYTGVRPTPDQVAAAATFAQTDR